MDTVHCWLQLLLLEVVQFIPLQRQTLLPVPDEKQCNNCIKPRDVDALPPEDGVEFAHALRHQLLLCRGEGIVVLSVLSLEMTCQGLELVGSKSRPSRCFVVLI